MSNLDKTIPVAERLVSYVVYGPNNVEHPGVFVVRRWVGSTPDPEPASLAPDLTAARAAVPGVLNYSCPVCFARSPEDDPCVIETWL